jgi:hypothetical protein
MFALVATVSGCGHAKPATKSPATQSLSPAAIRIENRLRARGYTVTTQKREPLQPYEVALSVGTVDFTSPHAFNVAIYLFKSKSEAEAHKRGLRSPGLGSVVTTKVVGADVFLASPYGPPTGCKVVNGGVHCLPQAPAPAAEFDKLIVIATRR